MIEHLMQGVGRNHSVRHLQIHRCNLTGSVAATAIRDALINNRTMVRLRLGANQFRDSESACLISEGILANGSCLQELDMQSNPWSAEAMSVLAPSLSGAEVDLRNVCLSSVRVPRQALLGILNGMRLEDLDLGHAYLDGTCAQALSIALMDPHCTLKRINLQFNNLGDDGIDIVCSALAVNVSLTYVTLPGLNHDSIRFLVRRLAQMTSIEMLEFDWSCNASVRPLSMPRLFLDAMRSNKSLSALKLTHPFGSGPWDDEIAYYLLRNQYMSVLHPVGERTVARSVIAALLAKLYATPVKPNLSMAHRILRDGHLWYSEPAPMEGNAASS